eukprot:scaffold34818_cov68-Phaeocystis_antarctica.AAC.3
MIYTPRSYEDKKSHRLRGRCRRRRGNCGRGVCTHLPVCRPSVSTGAAERIAQQLVTLEVDQRRDEASVEARTAGAVAAVDAREVALGLADGGLLGGKDALLVALLLGVVLHHEAARVGRQAWHLVSRRGRATKVVERGRARTMRSRRGTATSPSGSRSSTPPTSSPPPRRRRGWRGSGGGVRPRARGAHRGGGWCLLEHTGYAWGCSL